MAWALKQISVIKKGTGLKEFKSNKNGTCGSCLVHGLYKPTTKDILGAKEEIQVCIKYEIILRNHH